MVIGLTHPTGPRSMKRPPGAAEFGNPMYLFGKVLNALMLSPIEADVRGCTS